LNPSHGVDDVRNGILMDKKLHPYFDEHQFSIFLNDGVYTISVASWAQHDLLYLDKRVIAFNRGSIDYNLRTNTNVASYLPHGSFLAVHNMEFDYKNMQAEETLIEENDMNAMKRKVDIEWEAEVQEQTTN